MKSLINREKKTPKKTSAAAAVNQTVQSDDSRETSGAKAQCCAKRSRITVGCHD